MVYYRTKPTSLYSCTDDVIETKCDIPQSFMNEYIPIKTPGDGKCLLYGVSIALNGTQNVTRHLHLLLISVFVLNINTFMSIISKDKAHVRHNVSVEKYFEHIVYSAQKWREWGIEYHLLGLAIGLQQDIYCYAPFSSHALTLDQMSDPDKLKELFDMQRLSNHLLYRAPNDTMG